MICLTVCLVWRPLSAASKINLHLLLEFDIHAQSDVHAYSSLTNVLCRLYQAWSLAHRLSSTKYTWDPASELDAFIVAALGRMSSGSLAKSYGRGKDGRLLERVFQMSFFEAAASLFPPGSLSPDVGTVSHTIFPSLPYIRSQAYVSVQNLPL